MKYLVMECHPAYAVVLTEDGRFLKAANMHYEVGQTVTEIIQLHLPESCFTVISTFICLEDIIYFLIARAELIISFSHYRK